MSEQVTWVSDTAEEERGKNQSCQRKMREPDTDIPGF